MNRLDTILERANAERWEYIIPNVPLRLRIAIDSLHQSHPNFMNYTAAELELALRGQPGIAAQFSTYNDLTIAFAIRDKRLQAKVL
ncbi:MAG: hypothetical protein AAB618_01510 [Patescibacteria group bacterium]